MHSAFQDNRLDAPKTGADRDHQERVVKVIQERRVMLARQAQLAKDLVAYALGVERSELDLQSRGRPAVAFARQIAMYLTHTAFEASLNATAAAFQRDRSTVAHACRLIEDRREDFDFDAWLSDLEQTLLQAPKPRLTATA